MKITVYGPDDPIPGCDACGHICCVCDIKKAHHEDCKFRIAATGIAIACDCDWPRDVCPTCDPCTCDELRQSTA